MGAFVSKLFTAVADVGGLINPLALLLFKIIAGPVADSVGAAGGVTEEYPLTGIGFSAAEPMDAKVVWIIKTALVPGIWDSVFKDLVGNGGRVFAEITGDLPEGLAFSYRVLNISPVSQCKVFMVPRD